MNRLIETDQEVFKVNHPEAIRFLEAAHLRHECYSLSVTDPIMLNEWARNRLAELMATPACQVGWFQRELASTPNANVFKGYAVDTLRSVFSALAQAEDWKAPISRRIPIEDSAISIAAIEFFTATEATIHPTKCKALQKTYVEIVSVGYRMGPAGDH